MATTITLQDSIDSLRGVTGEIVKRKKRRRRRTKGQEIKATHSENKMKSKFMIRNRTWIVAQARVTTVLSATVIPIGEALLTRHPLPAIATKMKKRRSNQNKTITTSRRMVVHTLTMVAGITERTMVAIIK